MAVSHCVTQLLSIKIVARKLLLYMAICITIHIYIYMALYVLAMCMMAKIAIFGFHIAFFAIMTICFELNEHKIAQNELLNNTKFLNLKQISVSDPHRTMSSWFLLRLG